MTSFSKLWQTIKWVVLSQHSLFIFLMFLSFFPLKTQLHNLLYIAIDVFFNNSRVSEVYTYNYVGQLIGCKELELVMLELGQQFETFIYSFQISALTLSLLSFIFLMLRQRFEYNFKLLDWILLIVFCFYVIDSIEYFLLLNQIPEYDILKDRLAVIGFISNTLMLCLAAYLILFKLKKLQLLQIGFVALPACVLSLVVWYFYLGPNLLPVIFG